LLFLFIVIIIANLSDGILEGLGALGSGGHKIIPNSILAGLLGRSWGVLGNLGDGLEPSRDTPAPQDSQVEAKSDEKSIKQIIVCWLIWRFRTEHQQNTIRTDFRD
jgi:hypothetical protein